MDERTENALREIVTIVGRAFATGCTMLSADDERAIAEVLERLRSETRAQEIGTVYDVATAEFLVGEFRFAPGRYRITRYGVSDDRRI